ncbi:hypothetical protein [Massilia genomosp. 1]|uniref:DUF1453 domain-containing protein n=1 Tax=Massilia genomosp. 1 TaxID=2609280 RepID=A0ABX0MTM9_9BURK|nr:hypothetical protein [Massilia genomosp. 1]NHZ61209.1 hypothetical protein [Massilia genomosp. 1]
MSITTIALLVLAPFLVWRFYQRLKAMMTRQRSIVSRHYTGLGVFAAMILVAGSEVTTRLPLLGWLAVGTAAGIAYGIWGLKLTRFENDTCYFTPNARLGMVIAMLFFARVMYIGVEIYANQGSGVPTPGFTDSFITLLALGLTAGYFGTYSAGLIRWRRALKKAINAA